MTLFDYYARYMTELWEGKRPAPAGITLPEDGDEKARIQSLAQQLQAMGMAEFVRACAAQDGTVLPEELFSEHVNPNGLAFFLRDPDAPEAAPERPATPDPDANKHAFEVFLDCIAMDDGLVQYLIDVLKRMDRKEFFKLSQITTKLDLDPEEFLYWLGRRELYAGEEEQACAVWRRRDGWTWWRRCSAATRRPSRRSAAKRRSLSTPRWPPMTGTPGTIWIGTTPSVSSCVSTA